MENRRKPTPPAAALDINCDCKEYVLDYLAHSFPVQLYEPFTDSEGNLASRPAFDADGNPILNREACRARDAMLERLAALPPVPGALDQIVQHFGSDAVAEVTGRSRRIVPRANGDGSVRFAVDKVQSALEQIAPGAPQTRRAACARMAGRLKAFVDYGSMDEVAAGGIQPFLASVLKQCEAIHDSVYKTYISYGLEDVVKS